MGSEQTAAESWRKGKIPQSNRASALYIKLMVAAITKAGLEAEIARVVSRFHEDQNGCKPEHVAVHLMDDMVVARLGGCFTPTELQLVTSQEGRKFVKSARAEQRSFSRKDVARQVGEILGVGIVRSYWDLDVRIGEQVELYVFEKPFVL